MTTIYDELRSVQRYLSMQFPTAEIRRSRPPESVQYDFLIEPFGEFSTTHRGANITHRSYPMTIHYWATSFDDALAKQELMLELFERGVSPGAPRAVPVWDWSDLPTDPAPSTSAYTAFLKVEDLSARILEQDEPGRYVVVLDLRLRGYRATRTTPAADPPDNTINVVELEAETP